MCETTGIYLRYLQTTDIIVFEITVETPETVIDIIQKLFHQTVGRYHTLSLRNRIMIFALWLRSPPPAIPYAINIFSETELCFFFYG
jgi:hypothetical protein